MVFNSKQSESILRYGKITSGKKRATAYANGTANSSGMAFVSGSGSFIGSGSHTNGSSGSGTSTSNSGTSDSSYDYSKDFKEVFDWIEVLLDRFEKAIDSLDSAATSIYKTWGVRNNSLTSEISKIVEQIKNQEDGYKRYLQEANAVGLNEAWAKKVRDGVIDIDVVYDEKLAEQIKDYQNWYNKAVECKYAVDDLNESLSKCYELAFSNISTQYEGILAVIEHERSLLDEYISQSEAKGWITSTNYFTALISKELENAEILKDQRAAMIAEFNKAVDSGAIAKNSEAYAKMVEQIDDVTLAIEKSNTAVLEYQNSIREVKWEVFDLLRQKVENVTDELSFLNDLFENDKLYEDNGQLTNAGKTAMGLYGIAYNTYMAEADEYAKELLNIEKDLAENPYDQKLLERRQDLLEAQQNCITAAEEQKQAIISMVNDGIELEISSMQELISKYSEALDSQSDLFNYQKNIKSQVKEISSLEKQRASYLGDLSEETKAKLQKIEVSLSDARDNLESTQYDRYISDQKKLLDDLATEYSDILNTRLDDTNALIADMLDSINKNSDIINSTLTEKAESVGYGLSDFINSVMSGNGNIVANYTDYIGKGISSATTTINSTLVTMNQNLQNMIAQLNALAGTNISSVDASSIGQSLKEYGTGKYRISANEVAWTQDGGNETIIRPSDGAILTPLKTDDMILNPVATDNLWRMTNDPARYIKDVLSTNTADISDVGQVNRTYMQTIENVVFSMPNVKNYNEILSAMRKDKNFERLINAMTLDKVLGNSSLGKGKSIRNNGS